MASASWPVSHQVRHAATLLRIFFPLATSIFLQLMEIELDIRFDKSFKNQHRLIRGGALRIRIRERVPVYLPPSLHLPRPYPAQLRPALPHNHPTLSPTAPSRASLLTPPLPIPPSLSLSAPFHPKLQRLPPPCCPSSCPPRQRCL